MNSYDILGVKKNSTEQELEDFKPDYTMYNAGSIPSRDIKDTSALIAFNFKEKEILISAQAYLINFYNNLGFVQQGEQYLEDDIPHIKMLKC